MTAGILTITTAVLPLFMAPPIRDCQFGRMGDPAADKQAVAVFDKAVTDYANLHRRLARAWPPLSFVSDREQAELVAEDFRRVLRDARPHAAQGNFFTPEVAYVVRVGLANAVRESTLDVAGISLQIEEEGDAIPSWWTPVVNEPLPLGAAGAGLQVGSELPALPSELEYRLVGRDLVLLDAHANRVLDVLELAAPEPMESFNDFND